MKPPCALHGILCPPEPCEVGTYHNTTTSTCAPCPAGQYQHLVGQAGCWPCQGVMTTAESGATSPDHCICEWLHLHLPAVCVGQKLLLENAMSLCYLSQCAVISLCRLEAPKTPFLFRLCLQCAVISLC